MELTQIRFNPTRKSWIQRRIGPDPTIEKDPDTDPAVKKLDPDPTLEKKLGREPTEEKPDPDPTVKKKWI